MTKLKVVLSFPCISNHNFSETIQRIGQYFLCAIVSKFDVVHCTKRPRPKRSRHKRVTKNISRYIQRQRAVKMVLPRFILRGSQILTSTKFLNISKTGHINFVKLFNTSTCLLADRQYTDKHEWVEISGKVGIIGISHYAQEALGDVVYAQLPDVGTVLKQQDECGALESVKAASELYCPISGRVTEKNTDVENTPSLINSSCYEKGWLFKVEFTDDKELPKLMNENQYKEFLKSDEHH